MAKSKKIKQYSKWLTCDMIESIKRDGNCIRGYPYIRCDLGYQCHLCHVADTLRRDDICSPAPIGIAQEGCVDLQQTSYYKKYVLVTDRALEKFGRKHLLYYQMFYCSDGPGCVSSNPSGQVFGYFLSRTYEPVTLMRSDILGIPTAEICRVYDNYFFTKTFLGCGYGRKEVGAIDCIEESSQKTATQISIKF